MLIAAAADIWEVYPASCRAEKGFVIHDETKRKLSYGQLAEKASQMKPPQDVPLKAEKDYKIIGKSMKRLDTPEKINGKAIFGIDVRIPGMLTAVVVHPPVFGGKVKSFNAEKAKAVPGVKAVVQIESGVAVVADSFWSAATWSRYVRSCLGRRSPCKALNKGDARTICNACERNWCRCSQGRRLSELRKSRRGTVPIEAIENGAKASKKLRAEYEVPYLAHATMEP